MAKSVNDFETKATYIVISGQRMTIEEYKKYKEATDKFRERHHKDPLSKNDFLELKKILEG